MTSPADLPAQPDYPYPLTFERLVALMAAQNLHVQTVGAAMLRGRWGENLYDLSVRTGEVAVLQMRGTSPHHYDRSHASQIATFANDWHREHIWPTVSWSRTSEDAIEIRTLFATDFTMGASEAQLRDTFAVGISTSTQAFTALRQALAD